DADTGRLALAPKTVARVALRFVAHEDDAAAVFVAGEEEVVANLAHAWVIAERRLQEIVERFVAVEERRRRRVAGAAQHDRPFGRALLLAFSFRTFER